MENKKADKHALVLAALLHDIWKFINLAQRKQNTKDTVSLTLSFFEEHFENIPCIKPISSEVKRIISDGENKLFKVIASASELDSGANKVGDAFEKNALLIPALSMVELQNPSTLGQYVYQPRILDAQNIFPVKETELKKNNIAAQLQNLYSDFTREIDQLPALDLPAFIDSLLFIYEKYLSFVTTTVQKVIPGISLYDHSRSVAALSLCYSECDSQDNPFLIIAADVSGIQSFIYSENKLDEGTRGTSKRLRGKSFFVSLLTDTFSGYLSGLFDVPRCNLLINGGGHFILLVPNTSLNREKIKKARNSIHKWFFRYFQGEINLVLEWLEADEGLYSNYSEWHDRISAKLQEGKRRKGAGILDEIFADGFNDYDLDALGNLTGEEKAEINSKEYNLYERFLKGNDYVFEKLGRIIPYAKYIVEIHSEALNRIKTDPYKDVLIRFNDWSVGWLLIKDENSLGKFYDSLPVENSGFMRVMKVNDTGALVPGTITGLPARIASSSFGFKFIGNSSPKEQTGKEEGVMEFEEIAGLNKVDGEALEYRLLQILRMDVDNLGTIFSLGLKRSGTEPGIESLSRIVNISRDLNLFFLGYLNKLAEQFAIYITYSGGDDLFTVGSWINTVDFAQAVKKDFHKFACGNPNVTISGGIYTSKPSFPVGRSAKLAGKLEERAKKAKDKKPGAPKTNKEASKNKIAIYGIPLEWQQFEELTDYGKNLTGLSRLEDENKGLKTSYVHFLLQQANEMFKRDSETGELLSDDLQVYFRKLALIKYSLARSTRGVTAKKISDNEKEADDKKDRLVLELAKLIFEPEKYLKYFVVPASYVIFKNRKTKSNTKE